MTHRLHRRRSRSPAALALAATGRARPGRSQRARSRASGRPASPTYAAPKDAQPGTRVEDALSIRQAEAGGVTLPDASSAQEVADDTPTTIIVQLEDGTVAIPKGQARLRPVDAGHSRRR